MDVAQPCTLKEEIESATEQQSMPPKWNSSHLSPSIIPILPLYNFCRLPRLPLTTLTRGCINISLSSFQQKLKAAVSYLNIQLGTSLLRNILLAGV